jgi:YHS domain-containing protein
METKHSRPASAVCRGSSSLRRVWSLPTLIAGAAFNCALLLGAWGCSKNHAPAPPANTADPAVTAALSELAPEDRALAETQGICPVSKEKLGSMGKPYAVEVKGRKVFLCCQGCEDALRSDPDKYLAILDEG